MKAKSNATSLINSFKLRTFDGIAINFGESRSFGVGEGSIEVVFEVGMIEVLVS